MFKISNSSMLQVGVWMVCLPQCFCTCFRTCFRTCPHPYRKSTSAHRAFTQTALQHRYSKLFSPWLALLHISFPHHFSASLSFLSWFILPSDHKSLWLIMFIQHLTLRSGQFVLFIVYFKTIQACVNNKHRLVWKHTEAMQKHCFQHCSSVFESWLMPLFVTILKLPLNPRSSITHP